MVNPLSIKCPHCTASFKIKDKSAFGKKVKCPKCETPFVIPKPVSIKSASTRKKKSKPTTLTDDFFDEESDSSSDFFDDDFDDWEDDLDAGPTARPRTRKQIAEPVRKQKSGKSIFATLSDYGFSPFITVTFVFLLLMNLTLFFVSPRLLLLSFFLSMLVGVGCLFAGGLGLLLEAGRESGTELVLCLLVPFYNLYFGISRFESTKNAIAAFIIGVALITTSMLLAFAGIFSPNRHTNFAQNAAPPNIARDIGNRPEIRHNPAINPNPLNNRKNQPDKRLSDLMQQNRPTNPQVAGSTPSPISKFDLSHIKPMPMTWPVDGVSGSNVYEEKSTGSIGNVFQALSSYSTTSGEHPAGSRMEFRVYLPPGTDATSKVPCVLVPPAGSNLLSGMSIDSSDLIPNPEHEPYLKAGFAVVTFSLDGHLLNRENSSNFQFQRAYEDFQKSQAGLVNCLRAFMETQAVIPGIDKNNIFIAGHSSAGTLSLLFAEHYPQIKGCLAYAASVDLEKNFKPHLAQIKLILPGVEDFIKKSSPKTHISSLTCPVFLFHSRQDPVTSFADTQRFVDQLKQQGTEVEFIAGNGADHYQPMIDEGIPKGIEWIKKIITKSQSAAADSNMVASKGKSDGSPSTSMTPAPQKNAMDLKRQKVTFKVLGFDDFHTNALKSNSEFWRKSLEGKMQMGLKEIVPGVSKGTESLDLKNMIFSFEFFGELPNDFSEQFASQFFTKSMKVDNQPISMVEVANDPNAQIAAENYLTFRILTMIRGRFNRSSSPKIIEANLKQIDRYVPDSLIMNYTDKWAYIKLKGIGNKKDIERAAPDVFLNGGLHVRSEKINIPSDVLAMNADARDSGTKSAATQPDTTAPASNTKQKFVIRYGVFGGNSLKIKDSVKRSLKGFVWVDQSSIKFNPDAKQITFINRSDVDHGALERALTRNKFYQLDISQEAVPEEKPASESTTPEKTEAKADTE